MGQFTVFWLCKQEANKTSLGQRFREFRKAKWLSLREIASRAGGRFTYLAKIENHKTVDGHGTSIGVLHLLAVEPGGDGDGRLLQTEKIPEPIRRQVIARPDAFRHLAELSDKKLKGSLAFLN